MVVINSICKLTSEDNRWPIEMYWNVNVFVALHVQGEFETGLLVLRLPLSFTFWFFYMFMLQIVLPVLYYIPGDQNHHSYENSLDALLMMKNDAKLLIMSGVFT